ncbi:uncharacterized protein P884DRAFT_89935 [Thermothelomyces heterothallicus CBS 202.75]|uniref:uncharacterized protein n=1 Tax=Thermothelomyces heterothallicus CBS 202.75 TaxID=1149848 RepID=UPI003742E2BA
MKSMPNFDTEVKRRVVDSVGYRFISRQSWLRVSKYAPIECQNQLVEIHFDAILHGPHPPAFTPRSQFPLIPKDRSPSPQSHYEPEHVPPGRA